MYSSGGARYRSSAFSSKSKKFEDIENSGSSEGFDDPVERWRVRTCPLGVPLGTGLVPLVSPEVDRDLDMTDIVALLLFGNLNFDSPGPASSISVREEADLGVRVEKLWVRVSGIPVLLRPSWKSATCLLLGVTPTVQLARRCRWRDLRIHHLKDMTQ